LLEILRHIYFVHQETQTYLSHRDIALNPKEVEEIIVLSPDSEEETTYIRSAEATVSKRLDFSYPRRQERRCSSSASTTLLNKHEEKVEEKEQKMKQERPPSTSSASSLLILDDMDLLGLNSDFINFIEQYKPSEIKDGPPASSKTTDEKVRKNIHFLLYYLYISAYIFINVIKNIYVYFTE